MINQNKFNRAMMESGSDEAIIYFRGLVEKHPNKLNYIQNYFDVLRQVDMDPEEKLKELQIVFQKTVLITKTSMLKRKIQESLELKEKIILEIDRCKRSSQEKKETSLNSLKSGNKDILDYLKQRLEDLKKVQNVDEFDRLIADVKKAEQGLVVSGLDSDDELIYDHLIDDYASQISSLTTYFSNIDLRKYNQEALTSFKMVIDEFKKNRRKYRRNVDLLSNLLRDKFFIYDTNKLYREVAEFYSFTYNFIFNRLDNDDKFLLAKLALEVSKK